MKKLFKSPEEMKKLVIEKETDLYSPELKLYVFHYNNKDAIAVYRIEKDRAIEIDRQAKETGEYWGGVLGVGGEIHDDSDEFFDWAYKSLWIETDSFAEFKEQTNNKKFLVIVYDKCGNRKNIEEFETIEEARNYRKDTIKKDFGCEDNIENYAKYKACFPSIQTINFEYLEG